MHGQAAMEYLVTYGWALLALFAVVAVLVSTGAFSSSNFSTRECSFQPDLPCSPFALYKDADATLGIRFSIANNLGFPIRIATMAISEPGGQPTSVTDLPPGIIQSGGQQEFPLSYIPSREPQVRDFKTIIVTMEYYNCKPVQANDPCDDTTASKYTTSGRISTVVDQGV